MVVRIIASLVHKQRRLCLKIVALFYWFFPADLLSGEPLVSVSIAGGRGHFGTRNASDIFGIDNFFSRLRIDRAEVILVCGTIKGWPTQFDVAAMNLWLRLE